MIEIDTWAAGCKVRAFDWIDGENIYLHMEYFRPGTSLAREPAKEKSVLLEKSEDTEYKLRNYLDTIVNGLMWA